MVVLPADDGVISPEDSSIATINSLPLVHTPPGIVLSKVAVPSEHTAVAPLNSPALKGAVTVTIRVAMAVEQPPKPVTI